MGLIRAGTESVKSMFADQWREFFYCDAMDADVLVARGRKKANRRSVNRKGSDNIITNGSIIAVNEGQCMLIVDQGRVAEICDEPGEFIYDDSTEPSVFYGDLGESVERSFGTLGRRFSFGGDTGKDQRVYFVNTKEIPGNKYGTVNPVPYRVVDRNIGLDLEISIRCHGEYSFHIVDPILFYTNVSGNVEEEYGRQELEGQMRSELLTAMQTAFSRIAEQGIRYYQLAAHTTQIADALNAELSGKWAAARGIEIVSFGISGVKASEEDEEIIKQLQRTAVFKNPGMAAASLTGAQADAMRAAASNQAAGPMMAFAGMNMAGAAGGMNAQELFAMAQADKAAGEAAAQSPQRAEADSWICSCGARNTGKFCSECGTPRQEDNRWVCSCGTQNIGKFCSECGKPKPMAARHFRCDKCGWQPEDAAHLPKFCPECGDRFDDNDRS